jgi:hypothetical protein
LFDSYLVLESDNETAYALAEAYADSAFLHGLTGSIKDDKKRLATYKDLFKSLIRTAANQSRDFAVQLNGCIGVMLWSEGHSEILTVGNVINKRKLWASLGGLSTMVRL